MAGSGEIKAGRAAVEVLAKDGATGVLSRISAKFKSFASSMKGIGSTLASPKLAIGSLIGEVLSVGSLAAIVKGFSDFGSEIHDMGMRTGMSAEMLSKLGYAADQTGASLDSVGKASKGMAKFIGDLANPEAAKTLHDLGVSAAQLKALAPDQQFETLAKAIAKVQDPTKRAYLAMKVFGKSGTELSEVFQDFDNLTKRAEKLGAVLSKDDAEAADALGDAFGDLKTAGAGLFRQIGAALSTNLKQLAERITGVVVSASKWLSENKELVASTLRVIGIVTGIGAAVGAAAVAVASMGAVFGGVSTVMAAVGAGFGVIMSVIGALLSPIGLVAAAVVGLGGYFLYASGMAGEAFGVIRTALGSLVDDTKGAFGAISTALAGGDLMAAANVLWTFLKVQWFKGTMAIRGYWNSAMGYISGAWDATVFGLAGALTSAWSGVQSLWNGFVTGLLAGWEIFTNGVIAAWQWVMKELRKGFAFITSFFKKTNFNAEAQKIEDDYAKQAADRAKASDAKLAAIGQGNLDRQKQIDDESKAMQQGLASQRQAAAAARAHGDADAIRKAEEDLKAAQAAFTDAKSVASSVKPIFGENQPEKPHQPSFDLSAMETVKTGGTFNATAATRMAGQPVMNRIATATESTARGVDKLTRKGKLAFS